MRIINGIKIAQKIERQISKDIKNLKISPCLSIILVGQNPASETYVRNKEKACQRLGIKYRIYRLSANTRQNQLLKLIEKLNKDKKVNGILVQLPLPPKINRNVIFYSIAPWKDVDGLNPLNVGFLETGQPLFIPPTAAASLEVVKYTGIKLKGAKVVMVGYSELIGKPLVPLLVDKGASVSVCHKNTASLPKLTKDADILITAVGKSGLIKASMVKQGAIVIDVGINRSGKKIKGDVDFEKVKKRASFITPVPGGIGPITVILLLKNLIKAQKYG